MSNEHVYYFGCLGESGHHLWSREGRVMSVGPLRPYDLDGLFCPGVVGTARPDVQPEGIARVTHVEGWTVLAFWDRSIDKRMGSHSTFVIEGEHDFAAAKAHSQRAWPRVWDRYSFDVREER